MEGFRRTNSDAPTSPASPRVKTEIVERKTIWETIKGFLGSGLKEQLDTKSEEFRSKMEQKLVEKRAELLATYPDQTNPEVMQKITKLNAEISTLESAINQWHQQ